MLLNKLSFYVNICAFLILLGACTKTEPSAIQKDSFIKNFGGAYGNEAIDLIKDNGNYYILGNSIDENDSTHIFLAKTDEFGNRVWPKDLIFSKENKQTKAGQIIKLEKQPGFAIIGAIEMDNSLRYFDTYFIIIDENGKVIKETVFNDTLFNDYGKCIGELQNGGFTISTLSDSVKGTSNKINLIQASSTGDFIKKSIIKDGLELFQICKKNNNEGFYIAAYSTKPIIILIDANGKYIGPQDFGSNIKGQIRGVEQDNSGNTYICGKLDVGSNGSNDGFIAKLQDVEESFNYEWLKEFGKSGADYLEQIVVTENNEILLTGSTEDTRLKTNDIWVLKTDIAGNFLSQTIIGGEKNEYGIRILESDNNRYVVGGTTYFENNSLISIFKSELK